jgi:hypothetical protein
LLRPLPRLNVSSHPTFTWPLQLLLRREPAWRDEAAAVVADDSPQALLLWVNEAARRGGILPGMRYAAALSLDRQLRARMDELWAFAHAPRAEAAAAGDERLSCFKSRKH